MYDTAVATITAQIQLAVAPVFLLAGVGAFLNVLANRLARVVDRSRSLAATAATLDEAAREEVRLERALLTRRIRIANLAIICCTASALFVCVLVATLFVAEPTGHAMARIIAAMFIVAMALLIAGLLLFLQEVRLALLSMRIGSTLTLHSGRAGGGEPLG